MRFGPWVGCLRWSAPTISRRLPTSSRKRKGRTLTQRYAALLEHYGLQATRTNPRSSHENTLSFPCADCQTPIKTNIAEAGANIASERSVVPGTRSDLMVTKQDGTEPRVIIEIVVHHDLEPVTRQKYEDSQIPVIKIAPTVKGDEKVYHCGGGIVYHRHDEKGLNWEPGGIRSGAGVRSSGVSQESTGSSDT